ncbi:MAG: sigma-54 dependent transcriptional regulator [bacterium]
MEKRREILVVDDDRDFASTLADRLAAEEASVQIATTAAEAMQKLQDNRFDLVLLDLGLPDTSGMDLIAQILAVDTTLAIIIVTGRSDLETAINAIKKGAYDFIVKPIQFAELWVKVVNAVQSRRAMQTIATFEKEMSVSYGFDQFIYRSETMKGTVDHLRQLSGSSATVLITGESGVGKELAARTLHYNGPRKLRPFVTVSCAAVPETLIENELFGHERGAFTDAFERQMGKFEYADTGTIFLDEIGDLSPMIQTKLLRVLQERTFTRIGGLKEIKVDVRVVAATNKDLQADVSDNVFRADLFYRLSVLPITIPPLRDRPEDIELLARHFLKFYARKTGKQFTDFSREAYDILNTYSWPGNVRELQNAVERAVVFGIPPTLVARDITLGPLRHSGHDLSVSSGPMAPLRAVEASHIAEVLAQCGWNISQAAHQLGIGRDTLYRKIKQYGITEKKT